VLVCNMYFFFQGSLIANMIMGILILKKKYVLSKYLSVFMITLGISICTIVSGKDVVSIILKQLKHCYILQTSLSLKSILVFSITMDIFFS
jgi:hypothetical protein